MKRNWIIEVLFSIIFLGSVFLTSGKFVNATNSPKNYFVLGSLLVLIVFVALSSKTIKFKGIRNKTFLWGVSTVCYLQSGFGFIQFLGWLPSEHSSFPVTGSFDNPAGFAAVLSMGFPVGLFLYIREKGVRKYLSLFISVVIAFLIVLSGSRTGIMAIVSSTAVFLFYRTNLFSRLICHRFSKFAFGLLIVAFVFGSIMLYKSKKDSADGRLLIWTVSAEMIQDKPLLGHGFGEFKAKYMDYQAMYFKKNPIRHLHCLPSM